MVGRAGRSGAAPLSKRLGGSYNAVRHHSNFQGMTYLSELGHVDQAGQVLEIRAFVVELPQSIVLLAISLPQWLERLNVVRAYETANMTYMLRSI